MKLFIAGLLIALAPMISSANAADMSTDMNTEMSTETNTESPMDGMELLRRDDDRRGRVNRGQCTVIFRTCNFRLGRVCFNYNNRSFQVNRFQARNGCQIAQRRYGGVQNCRVNCGGGRW